MKFHLFTKPFASLSLPDTAALAVRLGVQGLDLCIREGHPVNPANVEEALPAAAEILAAQNLSIGLVSAPPNLIDPDSPAAQALSRAMSRANLKLLKIGYFPFNPEKHPYHSALQSAREKLIRWAHLAQAHNFTICYHTHANYLGSSAGTLAAILHDLPSQDVCAYLDPAQLIIQGEGLPAALSILQNRVAAIGFKDVLLTRRTIDAPPHPSHGSVSQQWVQPGTGMVDWSRAAQAIRQSQFRGVLSLHVLMHAPEISTDHIQTAANEIAFYKSILQDPTP
jgi:sugar phosphate isomerase/epimerase